MAPNLEVVNQTSITAVILTPVPVTEAKEVTCPTTLGLTIVMAKVLMERRIMITRLTRVKAQVTGGLIVLHTKMKAHTKVLKALTKILKALTKILRAIITKIMTALTKVGSIRGQTVDHTKEGNIRVMTILLPTRDLKIPRLTRAERQSVVNAQIVRGQRNRSLKALSHPKREEDQIHQVVVIGQNP